MDQVSWKGSCLTSHRPIAELGDCTVTLGMKTAQTLSRGSISGGFWAYGRKSDPVISRV